MALIKCSKCNIMSDESETIWAKERDYEPWCYDCCEKDEAYAIFEKLSNGIPLRITEVLETKIYQKPSQE